MSDVLCGVLQCAGLVCCYASLFDVCCVEQAPRGDPPLRRITAIEVNLLYADPAGDADDAGDGDVVIGNVVEVWQDMVR